MTKEEFVDKVGVANKAIESTSGLLAEMNRKKLELNYQYIKDNKVHNAGDRVRVYKIEGGQDLEEKQTLGIGYVEDIFVDEADGLILYQISKEINKTKSQEKFFNEFAADLKDFQNYNMLIEKL